MPKGIQFLDPLLTESDIRAAVVVLRSGWITHGPVTKAFEKNLTRYVGSRYAIFNSSGTAALHVALLAAGVGPGHEVITSPLSYQATGNAILYTGAKPVFVDVEPETGLIDTKGVERAVTKRTRAILPVHLYGQMADMKALSTLARRRRLIVIEDSAHAIESVRDGIRPGQRSFASCLSFHAAKNITCGEGGAVICNSKKAAALMTLLCEGGVKRGGGKRWQEILGYKYSGTQFQAAMLHSQLKRIGLQWRTRKALWKRYHDGLRDIPGVAILREVPASTNAYHMFPIFLEPKRRDGMREALARKGVQTSVHFNPIHLDPYWRKTFGYRSGHCPVAERLGLGEITLPLHLKLTAFQQERVIALVREVMMA